MDYRLRRRGVRRLALGVAVLVVLVMVMAPIWMEKGPLGSASAKIICGQSCDPTPVTFNPPYSTASIISAPYSDNTNSNCYPDPNPTGTSVVSNGAVAANVDEYGVSDQCSGVSVMSQGFNIPFVNTGYAWVGGSATVSFYFVVSLSAYLGITTSPDWANIECFGQSTAVAYVFGEVFDDSSGSVIPKTTSIDNGQWTIGAAGVPGGGARNSCPNGQDVTLDPVVGGQPYTVSITFSPVPGHAYSLIGYLDIQGAIEPYNGSAGYAHVNGATGGNGATLKSVVVCCHE
jgi:hypothetical protein